MTNVAYGYILMYNFNYKRNFYSVLEDMKMGEKKNLPVAIGVTEVAALVDNIIQCYSQARITAEIQETECILNTGM